MDRALVGDLGVPAERKLTHFWSESLRGVPRRDAQSRVVGDCKTLSFA
jgi:hypothetical protein